MKKLLLFLLLFGSGLALLIILDPDEGSPGGVEDPGPGDTSPSPGAAGEPPDSSPGESKRLELNGPFEYASRVDEGAERLKRYVIDAVDSARRGDSVVLETVLMDLFNRSGQKRAQLKAESGVFWLVDGDAMLDFELKDAIELENAEIQLLEGGPIESVVLTTPSLQGDTATGVFDTLDPASIRADGFRGDGVGMHIELENGVVTFTSDGVVEIERLEPEPFTARLESRGPLGLRREPPKGPGIVRVTAVEQARLSTTGENAVELKGDEIELAGREVESEDPSPPPDDDDELGSDVRIETVDARGSVRFHSATGDFEGDEAHLAFDEAGELASAEITGDPPVATLALSGPGALTLPGLAGGSDEPAGSDEPDGDGAATAPVEITGSRVIELRRSDVDHVHVPGPARVSWGDGILTSEGGVEADATRGGDAGTLRAWETVVLTRGETTLRTPELVAAVTLTTTLDETGEPVAQTTVIATAEPPCSLTGVTRDGQPFTIESDGVLVFRQEGERWTLPEANAVKLVVEGEQGFRASADRVADFDPDTMTFTALGQVDFSGAHEGEWFRGRGELLNAFSETHFKLTGTEDDPAYFEGVLGSGTARWVERQGDVLYAGGDVSAGIALPGGNYDVRCQALEARRESSVADGEHVTERTHVVAEGRVDGELAELTRRVAVDCDRLELTRLESRAGDELVRASTTLVAKRVRRGVVVSAATPPEPDDPDALPAEPSLVDDTPDDVFVVSCDTLDGTQVLGPEADGKPVLEESLVALGNVVLERHPPGDRPAIRPLGVGRGDRLTIDGRSAGRLEPVGEGRVSAEGVLPGLAHPFDMTADWIEFGSRSVRAGMPEIHVTVLSGRDGEGDGADGGAPEERPIVARSRVLSATESSLLFEGDVRIRGRLDPLLPWVLESGMARGRGSGRRRAAAVRGRARERARLARLAPCVGRIRLPPRRTGARLRRDVRRVGVHRAHAHRGRAWRAGVRARSAGVDLVRVRHGHLRLEIGPGRGDGAQGQEEERARGRALRTGRFSAPLALALCAGAPIGQEEVGQGEAGQATVDPGAVAGELGAAFEGEWGLKFENQDSIEEADTHIQIYQQPVFSDGTRTIQATWAVLWFDREEYRRLFEGPVEPERDPEELRADTGQAAERRPQTAGRTLFMELADSTFAGVARELYLEGPIEFLEGGRRQGYAGALYLDLIDGHGWIADANVSVERQYRGDKFRLRGQAQWLRHSADGSLHADEAVFTSCGFDDPHVHFTTRDLRITPYVNDEGETVYRVGLGGNSLDLYDRIHIPLPSHEQDVDEEGRPVFDFSFGDEARFGPFARATWHGSLGNVGKGVNKALGGDAEGYDSDLKFDASWLGSRGPLLDFGVTIASRGVYRVRTFFGVLYDDGRDKGLVKTPVREREELRYWARTRGRYYFDNEQWVDIAFSNQRDPSVQSEFWEGEWFHYEERETYLHYRQARNEHYLGARVQVRTDDFRTEVERLPEVFWNRTPSDVGRIGPLPLYYGARASVARLSRVEGDGVLGLWQDPLFDDGLGDRDVFRIDTAHRLESPLSLGFAGLRAVPFVEAAYTRWDEGILPADVPERMAVLTGVEVATTLWRRNDSGMLFQLSPFTRYQTDVVHELDGGSPVPFDATERPVDGRFIDFGARLRILPRESGGRRYFDVELRGRHADGVPAGEEQGWRPIGLFVRYATRVLGMPFQFFEDMRYDVDDRQTVYALTSIGLEPTNDIGIVLGHRQGLDRDRQNFFEAASIASRYRWTRKWEFEVRHTIPIGGGARRNTDAILRRYGHDIVFAFELSNRSGEGTSLQFSVRPRLGFDPGRLSRVGLSGY